MENKWQIFKAKGFQVSKFTEVKGVFGDYWPSKDQKTTNIKVFLVTIDSPGFPFSSW